jgi:hypothetical protein
MFKLLTPLAIAALAVISIAPQSQAFPINLNSIILKQSSPDAPPRVIVNLGVPQPAYRDDYRWQRESRSHRYSDDRAQRRGDDRDEYRRNR